VLKWNVNNYVIALWFRSRSCPRNAVC